ncbi:DUF6304 family protein [Kitasatospora sp. NPDC057015]|uniref:DUF6304 family protein n=1 Tax=Kitasatospora sp. NPDC057015 TaxID=3346001 RepID=UPI00363464FE
MEETFTYAQPLTAVATVTDRWGETQGTLENDGQLLRLEFRGNRYEGRSPDALELVGAPARTAEPPETDRFNELRAYVLTWQTPVDVRIGGEVEKLPMTVRFTSTGGDHGVSLGLSLPEGDVGTERVGDLESALLDLRKGAREHGAAVQACATCSLSEYSPAGFGFMGDLACFRNTREEIRAARGKQDVFDLWEARAGLVQEIFSCSDFE